MRPQLSPVSRVRDALQKVLSILGRNGRPFEYLWLAIQHDDRGLTNVQPQPIRAIRMDEMKQIVHRIHAL